MLYICFQSFDCENCNTKKVATGILVANMLVIETINLIDL